MNSTDKVLSAPMILAVIVLLYSLSQVSQMLSTEQADKSVSPPTSIELDPLEPRNELSAPSKKPDTEQVAGAQSNESNMLVTRIVDGDTIVLENGNIVRYIGIDTPETVHPSKGVQCFGEQAKIRNQQLVEGKYVRLERDVSNTDKYNRLLRYVFVNDVFVNDMLVREGYAYSYTYPPDVQYQDQFRQAEREARLEKRGLWEECGITDEEIREDVSKPSLLQDVVASNCSSNTYDCKDFVLKQEAQSLFEECGGPSNDVHKLDQDGDGFVCESLP